LYIRYLVTLSIITVGSRKYKPYAREIWVFPNCVASLSWSRIEACLAQSGFEFSDFYRHNITPPLYFYGSIL